MSGCGRAGTARRGAVRSGLAWRGWAGQAWQFNQTGARIIMSEGTKSYRWASGDSKYGVAPERAAELFRSIEARDGTLTPAGLVDASRPNGAAFHEAFDWDDQQAAETYRRVQARRLIGSLVVVYQATDASKELPTRAFVSVVALDGTTPGDKADETVTGYLNLDTVMGDTTLRAQYLRAAARELSAWRRRYADLKELSSVFAAADAALARLL